MLEQIEQALGEKLTISILEEYEKERLDEGDR